METMAKLVIWVNLLLGATVFVGIYLRVIWQVIQKQLSATSLIFLGILVFLFLITFALKSLGVGGSFLDNPIPYLVTIMVLIVKIIFYVYLHKQGFSWSFILLIDCLWTVVYLIVGIYSSLNPTI